MRAQSTITKVTENLSLRLSCAIRSSFLCVLWGRIVKQANKCNQAESNEKWADWQQAESQRLKTNNCIDRSHQFFSFATPARAF